jgi:hypothetical protein
MKSDQKPGVYCAMVISEILYFEMKDLVIKVSTFMLTV